MDMQQALAAHNFGRVFALARKLAGISYSKIAQSCDIKPERVGMLARGSGAITSYGKIVQICDGLRIPGHYVGLLPRPWEDRRLGDQVAAGPTAVELAGQIYESELLQHLTRQWHHLVKTDNLLGPRAALRGVIEQIRIIGELLDLTTYDAPLRAGLLSLASRYAESASWLHEDAGDVTQADHWSARALQWAYEAADRHMLAWVHFRKSQQAANPRHSIALAQTALRDRDRLPAAMRSAITQQQAGGLARMGDETAAHRMFDDALETAVGPDVHGDAGVGHGAFCTPDYIELERARAWTALRRPERAVCLYEEVIPRMPVVYQRDRGVALARCATAHHMLGDLDHAVALARESLAIARTTGTGGAIADITALAESLRPHRALPAVDELLHDLGDTGQD
ncbi:hypothetical protein [Streptomonospora nanhaiensis]|uniref:hypothetical protein n=1 Tax=Streptomonospora nanhaiensis TaxID=1323731 RepID=UPI001C38D2DA|nr:hypothetical protein [Streptomonospora nanhaiensis]MBV2363982.1 hypothetical protein [Streptomonospora nanhaiensis]